MFNVHANTFEASKQESTENTSLVDALYNIYSNIKLIKKFKLKC